MGLANLSFLIAGFLTSAIKLSFRIIYIKLYLSKSLFQYYYMNFANSKSNAAAYKTYQKKQAGKAIFLSLLKPLLQRTRQGFKMLENLKKASKTHKRSESKYPLNSQIVKQQFINHCAVIIQSRFKGYLERKRYRLFLPIYRRVKQMLTAIYQGWKVRKIFKLQIVRNQIMQIKNKQKQGQISGIRIARRELCDDIQRLSKKGRWIEILQKQKINKGNYINNIGKENNSAYSNIKPISIKNIFGNKQPEKNIKSKTKLVVQPKNFKRGQQPVKQYSKSPEKKNNSFAKQVSDDRPIKGMSTAIFEEQYIKPKDKNTQLKPEVKKKIVKKPIKQTNKISSKQKVTHQQVVDPKISQHLGQNSTKKMQLHKNKQESISKLGVQQAESIKSMHSSKVSLQKAKKIQITLAATATQSLKSSVKSVNPISESSFNYNQKQQPRAPINIPSGKAMIQIIKTYNEKYLEKKQMIKNSIFELDFRYSLGVDKKYKEILKNY